jgi:hyperosmotically inducible periplasmic protein
MNSKPRLLLLLSSALSLCMLPGLHASEERPHTSDSSLKIHSARASELMGREVRDVDGSGFATLEDFVIDIENGRVVNAVISGSDAGDGRVEVPARSFDYTRKDKALSWHGERAKLGKAPRFNAPGSNRPGQAVHAAEVYRYYGEEPYFVVDGQTERKSPNNVHTHADPDSELMRVPLGRVMLASDLIGADIDNKDGKKIGAIQDLILDLPAGRVVAVIIGGGGFLGIGEAHNAVPPAAFDYAADDSERLQLTASRELLRNSPRYKSADAARFDEPGYTDEIYRSFEVEPYSKTVAADNTRANRRDRDGMNLTPMDQSNAKSDLEITARIRKAIMADDTLSVNAQNVKIITRDRIITLRGPVKNLSEKNTIGQIAARESGAGLRVDNKLEIAGE